MNTLVVASSTPTFGQLLAHVMQLKGMNQQLLSHRADVSPSYVSKLVSDQRDLTETLAAKLADVLGGTPEGWMKAYSESKSGAGRPLARQVADLLRGQALGVGIDQDFLGTPVRQLRRDDILKLFSDALEQNEDPNDKDENACRIEPFDPTRTKATSYDTRIGSIGRAKLSDNGWSGDPVAEAVTIKAGEVMVLGTLEHITLPKWLEAELHEASNIALKPLIISHGPVIDPGWAGRLYVTVFNPSKDKDVVITSEEPFLTLRFWIAESAESIR